MREEIKSRSSSKQRRRTDGRKRWGTDAGQEYRIIRIASVHTANTAKSRWTSVAAELQLTDIKATRCKQWNAWRATRWTRRNSLRTSVTGWVKIIHIGVVCSIKWRIQNNVLRSTWFIQWNARIPSWRVQEESETKKTHMCLKKERVTKRIGCYKKSMPWGHWRKEEIKEVGVVDLVQDIVDVAVGSFEAKGVWSIRKNDVVSTTSKTKRLAAASGSSIRVEGYTDWSSFETAKGEIRSYWVWVSGSRWRRWLRRLTKETLSCSEFVVLFLKSSTNRMRTKARWVPDGWRKQQCDWEFANTGRQNRRRKWERKGS